jgi:preprotein translocase subunit YajC
MLFTGNFGIGSIVAILVVILFFYMLLRPAKTAEAKLKAKA